MQPGPRSLQINNIVGEDEGMYTCNYNYSHQRFSETVAHINVIGMLANNNSYSYLQKYYIMPCVMS